MLVQKSRMLHLSDLHWRAFWCKEMLFAFCFLLYPLEKNKRLLGVVNVKALTSTWKPLSAPSNFCAASNCDCCTTVPGQWGCAGSIWCWTLLTCVFIVLQSSCHRIRNASCFVKLLKEPFFCSRHRRQTPAFSHIWPLNGSVLKVLCNHPLPFLTAL